MHSSNTEKVFKTRMAEESDRLGIINIHKKSFGAEKGVEIAKLVDDLLDDITAKPILSLVAVKKGKLIGHILFTKAVVTQTDALISAQILAPLAVLPDMQKCGIGQTLINEGLRRLKASGIHLVFVLGHPTYYPRCGFQPAGAQGFEAPYPIPKEHSDAWMVQQLNGTFLSDAEGNVQCSRVLNEPQHWRE